MFETGHEKRGMPRFPLQVPFVLRLPSDEVVRTTTRDISATGVFVLVPFPLQTGQELEFGITLPGELTLTSSIEISCKGTIVRVQEMQDGKLGVALTIHKYDFVPRADRKMAADA